MEHILTAINQAGGQTELARALTQEHPHHPVSKAMVWNWKTRGAVAPRYCDTIQRLYGVPAKVLNPRIRSST